MGVVVKGNFKHTERFFKKALRRDYRSVLDQYGQMGVDALSAATPVRSGLTAASWGYEIVSDDTSVSIVWTNSNVVDEWAVVAILIRYGHGTRDGTYVYGIDYISPAMQSVFNGIADAVWEEVTR